MREILLESFEADWVPGDLENPDNPNSKPGHKAIRIDAGTGVAVVEYNGSIFNPPGWTCFYRHGFPVEHDPANDTGWAAPEARHSTGTDPARFRTGERGQLLFTFSRIHDAGFFRPVVVGEGNAVRLSAWAHAWSNAWHMPTTDDPGWSEGAGYKDVAIPEGEAPNPDYDNFTFWVGVDPTGGLNPDGPNVVWSKGWHIYNGFAQVGPLEVVARTDVVTVFLRSRCLWPFKHNDAYWDDVRVQTTEPIPDPDPPTEGDHGSDVGIHYLTTGGTLHFQEALASEGARFKVVKGVSDWGALKEFKRRDPGVITVGRVHSDLEGVGGVNDPNADIWALAQGLVGKVLGQINQDPELRDAVDYWEICNEPLGGGSPTDAYERLGRVMASAMTIAEQHGLKLGIFAFNAGTPEWADMRAIVETGVFSVAKLGGHILTLHEGQLSAGPVDAGMGDLIPGAPSVPEGAGSMNFRFKYLYSLLEARDEVIPLFVSEWYPGGDRADIQDIVSRYIWYDKSARPLPYFLGFAGFTCGAAYGWEGSDQEPYYPGVMQYMVSVKDELNWGPGPDPCECRGAPRDQYERTYVLLPPGAGLTWMNSVTAATWDSKRWTVGNSADDAGIGDLDVRQIVAVNPDAWGAGTDGRGLLGFLQEHYPGVVARMVYGSTPSEVQGMLSGRTFGELPLLKPFPAHKTPDPPDPPPSGGLFSIHAQTPIDGWGEFIESAKPSVAVVFWAEAARLIKEWSPHTFVMWRPWLDDAEQDRLLYMADPFLAAHEYLAHFADAVRVNEQWIDYVPSLNERYTWDNDRTSRAALFDAAFAQVLHSTGLGVRAGLLAGPVGYPNLSQVNLIRPAVEAAAEYGSVVLYHAYYMMHNGASLLDRRWEQDTGLFLDVLDPVFRSWGHELFYLAGELGPVGSKDGQSWEFDAGWRSPLCYGGDQVAFLDGLERLHARLAFWNAANHNRFLGGGLFTSGDGIGWDSYRVERAQLEGIVGRFYAS